METRECCKDNYDEDGDVDDDSNDDSYDGGNDDIGDNDDDNVGDDDDDEDDDDDCNHQTEEDGLCYRDEGTLADQQIISWGSLNWIC